MTIETFLLAHGSALILPLSVAEGPLVGVLTGFLAAQGYFNIPLAVALLLSGDLIGDLIYYAIGRFGAGRLAWLSARLGVAHRLTPSVQHGLKENATRMLLIGKWTHSVGFAVLIGCGVLMSIVLGAAGVVAISLLLRRVKLGVAGGQRP